MNTYEVWTEGFATNGQRQGATFHGLFEGHNFKEAVISFYDSANEKTKSCIDIDRMTFWGCRFFDNEDDARKSFG